MLISFHFLFCMSNKKTQQIRIVTYPNLEKEQIHRYERVQIDPTHYNVRCIETIENEDGVRCWCSMKPVREDHYKDWLKTHVHVCTPGIPCYDKTLNDYFSSGSTKAHFLNLNEDSIYDDMAEFTGKYNLSLNIFSSDDFYNLACKFIAFGISLYDLNNPIEKARKNFRQMKRDKLRSTLIKVAYKKHRKILDAFEDIPYVSLALDEGKTSSHQNLHFVLESPFTDLPSYPFDTLRMEGGKAKHYVASIMKGLYSISRTKIAIGTVVCDGNTAQKKAFNPDWNKSLYHKKIPDIKKIIYVPCLCHRIHRSYVSCYEKNPVLTRIVDKLHTLSAQCRDHVADVGTLCPAHIETRWIYDYNIVAFIIKNAEIIKHFTTVPIDELNDLKQALVILKTLVSKFESPKTKFQNAFLYLERGINALFQLHRKGNRYAQILALSLQSYTLGSKDCGLWSLAYCFTRKGRSDFRTRNLKRNATNKTNYLSFFDPNLPPDDDDENTTSSEYSSVDDIFMTTDGKDPDNPNTDTSDDDYVPELDEEEDLSNFPDDDSDSTQTDSDFINYFNSAKETLKALLKQTGLSEERITACIQNFNIYMDTNGEIFKFLTTSEEDYSWLQINSTLPDWEEVADIALRLLNSACSEASCERMIKKQRFIHTARRLASTKQLLDARLILSS